jgi:phosphatidylserine synthase
MSRTAFSNPNDPVISAYTASILDGADGRLAKYGLIKAK